MNGLLSRLWWQVRLFLLRARGKVFRRDVRAELMYVGLEAARHGALSTFSAAVRAAGGLSGWDAPTRASAAGAYYDAGQTAEAERLFAAALREGSNDPTVLSNYGWYLFKKGSFEEAAQCLERALAARPSDPWIVAWLAGCYFRLGRMDEAQRCFTQSLKDNPSQEDVGPAYDYLGHIAARRENWDEAARLWREAARRLPQDEQIWYNLGDALLGAGEYREAIRALKRSLRLGSEGPAWTHYDLARCYQQLGDIRRARAACEQALRYEPQDQDALDLKSELEGAQMPGHRAE